MIERAYYADKVNEFNRSFHPFTFVPNYLFVFATNLFKNYS